MVIQVNTFGKKNSKKIRLIEKESSIYHIQIKKSFLGIKYWKTFYTTYNIGEANDFYTEFIKVHNFIFR